MPTNPWKLTTFALAGCLLVSHALADDVTDRRKQALVHLEKAVELMARDASPGKGKEPEKTRLKDASSSAKALELTRAAIIHMKRSIDAAQ